MKALGLVNYWVFIFLMMVGLYILISQGNLIKKIVGLNIFQTSVLILYISMGKIEGGKTFILYALIFDLRSAQQAIETANVTQVTMIASAVTTTRFRSSKHSGAATSGTRTCRIGRWFSIKPLHPDDGSRSLRSSRTPH